MITNNKLIPFYSFDPSINEKYEAVINTLNGYIEAIKNYYKESLLTLLWQTDIMMLNQII